MIFRVLIYRMTIRKNRFVHVINKWKTFTNFMNKCFINKSILRRSIIEKILLRGWGGKAVAPVKRLKEIEIGSS